ncbi:MAG: aspartate dehydrogenase [Candidatus Tectimicrobiota bacterium]
MRLGIVGLGVIGQALARAIDRGDVPAQLTAVTSRNLSRAQAFAQTLGQSPAVLDLDGVIAHCDLVIEAATQAALALLAPPVLQAGKGLMVLSVGGLLDHPDWPALAARHGGHIYVPSGAIVGLDGLKGACMGRIDRVTITTRKPPQGLAGAPYVEEQGIDVYAFHTDTVIFEGSARQACQGFPANVNVAAALSLAGIGADCTRIRIIVAPHNTRNMHDVEVEGEFGRFTTHIENVPTENPRTGKLAYLSALAMLKQLVSPLHCGT